MFVELQDINKSFGNVKASQGVSFGIEKGKLSALLGPSGSGKTTVLRMIAGLETADEGEIRIDGKRVNELEPRERGIGFVFQNYALFRYMNVYENIAFGLKVQKMSREEVKNRVEELLSLVELKGLEKRFPNELSGGQRQRVAFARALAPEPSVLLLDEPFAAIDAKVRGELRRWLRDMIHRVGITSIFVTHDQDEAVEVADGIIVMDKGRIEQTGTPGEIYRTPKTAFVAGFIGEPVIIKDFGRLKGFSAEGYDHAVIRPEFVEAFKSDNAHFKKILPFAEKGVIKDIVFRGNTYAVKLDVGGMELVCHRSLERRPIEIGEQMNVIVYRLFAVKGNDIELMKNGNLGDDSSDQLEKYLYGDSGYFVG